METIRLISWNVNGVRAVANKEALRWIDLEEVDVLCLQEIKAEAHQIPEGMFERTYAHHYVNSAKKKGYSGTSTWSNLPVKEVAYGEGIDKDEEGRIIETHHERFVLFNVYFPNGQQSEERLAYKMAFYEDFLARCNALKAEGKSIVVCGDVNTAHCEVDIKNPKSNEKRSGFLPEERAWIDRFLDSGFIDTFRTLYPDETDRYSWWSYRFGARAKNIGWRIDYFYVSEDLASAIHEAEILEHVMGSDHCPIALHLVFK